MLFVNQLVNLGFDEVSAKRAYIFANKDSNEAANFLLGGHEEVTANSTPAVLEIIDDQECEEEKRVHPPRATAASSLGGEETNSIRFLRFHPEFLKLKRHFQTATADFPAVLHETGSLEPELLKMLNDNPLALLGMMHGVVEGVHDDTPDKSDTVGALASAGNFEADENQVLDVEADENQVLEDNQVDEEWTQDDDTKVEGLCALGDFDKDIATNIYVMSGKDVTKAASFLLSHET